MKLITFTVPCYNSAAYMDHCIETLLTAGEDAEIILVDDGSKDDTGKIADSYAEKYGRKSVRKNVTIPAWLDTFGEQAGINYSQVLREGLERRYNDLQNA